MRKRKGQAAIEFITTYSWAIMIIFLTIGALSYFDIFNVGRFISEKCETGAQISCVEAAMSDEDEFRMRVVNNYPIDINIIGIYLRGDGQQIGENDTTTTIKRGSIEELIVNDVSTTGSSREMFDVIINFQRPDSSRSYNVTGSVVVRPVSEDVLGWN